MLLNFRGKEVDFKGTVNHHSIPTRDVAFGSNVRVCLIADLHGYTNDVNKMRRLAERIAKEEPDIIMISGDIFHGGDPWMNDGGKNSEKYKNFQLFVKILSEVAPVLVTWGNHDQRGLADLSPEDQQKRLDNFKALADTQGGNVYPLYKDHYYNDKLFINGMEVIGYVPSFNIIEGTKKDGYPGLPIQNHGIASDKFFEEIKADGPKFMRDKNGELLKTHKVVLTHNPNFLTTGTSLKEDVMGEYVVYNESYCGHIHGGYGPVLKHLGLGNIPSLQYDRGWTEQVNGLVDRHGNKIKATKRLIWGKCSNCRGIVYTDNTRQPRIWQSITGAFYENKAFNKIADINNPTEEELDIVLNNPVWVPIAREIAHATIITKGYHGNAITEGIAPGFLPFESDANIDFYNLSNPVEETDIGGRRRAA